MTTNDGKCPICKSTDGCEFTGKYLGNEKNLSVEDWREIYHFIRHEFLPLLHRLIYHADKRAEKERELFQRTAEGLRVNDDRDSIIIPYGEFAEPGTWHRASGFIERGLPKGVWIIFYCPNGHARKITPLFFDGTGCSTERIQCVRCGFNEIIKLENY